MKTKDPSLKPRFNTASVAPRALDIFQHYMDPHTGAMLACAEIPALYADRAGLKAGPIFLVGWIPAGHRTMLGGVVCRSVSGAEKRFNAQRKIGHPPKNVSHFNHDSQRERLYQWESNNTSHHEVKLSLEKMAHVVGIVANDFGMKPPALSFKNMREGVQEYNYYFPDSHRIEMREKKLSVLLHELAHAIDIRINKNKSIVFHGPSFARTLICLAALYRHYRANDLETGMKESGLLVAPLDDLPELKKTFNALQKKQPAHIVSRMAPCFK